MFRVCLTRYQPRIAVRSLARPVAFRSFSSSTPARFLDLKNAETPQRDAALNKIKEQIQAIPELKQAAIEFKELLVKKGYLKEGEPINAMGFIYRILSDRDLRGHLGKMNEIIEEHRGEINDEDFKHFITAMLRNKKSLTK